MHYIRSYVFAPANQVLFHMVEYALINTFLLSLQVFRAFFP